MTRTRAVAVAGALAAVAAVALVVAVAASRGEPDPVVAEPTEPAPTTTTEPAPEPTVEPTETAEPPPEAEPFDVRLVEGDGIHVITTDNAPILSRASLEPDEEVAGRAAEIARGALEDFLNAQFTDRQRWFGDEAIEALLTPRAAGALDGEARAGLGRLDLDVGHVVTGEAEAEAMVTMLGDRPRNVTLDFLARLTAVDPEGAGTPLRMRGTLVFVPTEDGWLVEAADVRLVEDDA